MSEVPEKCPDCEYHKAWVGLCEYHAALSAEFQKGRIFGYELAKGKGSHRRDFPEYYEGMVAS